MFIHDRDRQVVMTVGRFGQLATEQIRTMHFDGVVSPTPVRRCLERLVANRFLARIERRMVGGAHGGSGQYVYQLGSAGWKFLGRERRYNPQRAVSYHTLAIADAYVSLLEYERRGNIEIVGFETEPDTRRVIAGVDLRPDLFLDVRNIHKRERHELWLEVDLGTERASVIRKKLTDYKHAYDYGGLETFPMVVFLAPDAERAKDLRWIIERMDEDTAALATVLELNDFAWALYG